MNRRTKHQHIIIGACARQNNQFDFAASIDSDQPRHLPRVFAVCLQPRHLPRVFAVCLQPRHLPRVFAVCLQPRHLPRVFAVCLLAKHCSCTKQRPLSDWLVVQAQTAEIIELFSH